MEVTPVCLICEQTTECGCKSALERYFALLSLASDRVSQPPTVTHLDTIPTKGLIDKLSGSFSLNVPWQPIREKLQDNKIAFKKTRLKDRCFYIQIGIKTGTFLRLANFDQEIAGLISNPSNFESYQDYRNHLISIFPEDLLSDFKIQRMDLAVDYEVTFSKVLGSLDVSRKKAQFEFVSTSGQLTGIRIGKGFDKISAYDKQIESNVPSPRSRIERQISGKKLPTHSLERLPTILTDSSFIPFSDVKLWETLFKDSNLLTPQQRSRQNELKVLIKNNGLLQARKKLNTNDNFKRDYGHLMQLNLWHEQPDEVFRKSIKTFFQNS
ncbi:MAG: hypothetical protein ACXWRA_08260 [Pseudobdellovibrionaceae bacterium]